MCGIAGFIGAAPGSDIGDIAEAMAKSIAYRGPDDQGIWTDGECETALVHRRLSIIDLSAAGHQPMLSADERYVISYNGEVYSFQPIAAELKALRAHPGWTPRIDQSAVAAFLRHNYIPAPRTIYEGVYKLEPGTVLTLPWRGEPKISRFWDARSVARDGSHNPLEGSDAELTEQLESLLKDAVGRRMIADVPLGAFLSGGVDSSTVVALMQAAKSGTVKSFSIGFDIEGYNEAPHAAAVARHL